MRITELADCRQLEAEEIQKRWEAAYVRFESPEEEINKFIARLDKLGQRGWPRDWQVVEIFCGRGNGLRAWERLGFTRLEGVDIAPSLLDHYQGIAKLYIADCRQLPLPDQSRDIVSVNGGLHHLPNLPEDLDQTLSEVRRTLRPTGLFLMVEPWMSPFLRILHLLSNIDLLRWAWPKVDAFATMNHYEWETYDAWMKQNVSTKKLLQKHFQPLYTWERWGKYYFVGQPRT